MIPFALIFFLWGMVPLHPQGPEGGDAAATGTAPIWRQALGGAVLGPPSAQAETVTVVCDGGNLRSYTRQGSFLWNYFARGRLSPFVSRSPEGTSYICRTNGVLIAVNRSGRELWRISLGAPIISPVLVGWDGRIFACTEKTLDCFTASGYRLWGRKLEQAPALAPRLDSKGGLIVALENRQLLEFDPFGAAHIRELSVMPAVALPLAGTEGSILLLYSTGRAEISRGSAEPVYLPSLGAAPLAAAARGENAAIALANGRVLLLSVNDGRIRWTGDTGMGASGQGASGETVMIWDERGIYVLSKSGAAGFTGDGRRLWVFQLQGSAAVPSFGDEGILYAGGADWILYAYRLEDRVRQVRRSLYGPAPEGSYGTANPLPSPRAGRYFSFDETDLAAQLTRISRAIREGQIGEEEKHYTAYLMEVAGSMGTAPRPETRLHPPVHIRYRSEAARLLGYMGSRETIAFLAGLYSLDPDPLVKAAAADAIGRIGVDPDGTALRAFTNLVFPPFPYRDEQTLTATAAAAAALCRFSGPPLSNTGIKLLVALSGDDRPRVVRDRARQELASLR
jgi:outer membrane protein assembly factor BamB